MTTHSKPLRIFILIFCLSLCGIVAGTGDHGDPGARANTGKRSNPGARGRCSSRRGAIGSTPLAGLSPFDERRRSPPDYESQKRNKHFSLVA
jgi:hypothetical protein